MRFLRYLINLYDSPHKQAFFLVMLFLISLVLSSCADSNTPPGNQLAATTTIKQATSVTSPSLKPPTPKNMPDSVTRSSISNTSSVTTPTIQNWQNRWLQGIPCRPPCFEGITPGSTKIEEALKLLKNNLLVKDVATYPSGDEYKLIGWNWIYQKQNTISNAFNAYLLFVPAPSNETIVDISPLFTTSFKLGDIIKTYGEPSHVIANVDYNYDNMNELSYNIAIIYLSQGFAISPYSALNKAPEINPDLTLEDLNFYIPNNKDNLRHRYYPSLFFITTWQGYKSFEYYCLAANPKNEKCKRG